jgi:hypothetical protein
MGWVYRRVGELPTVLGANLRWLAGYHHERVRDQPTVARIREVVDHYPEIAPGELAHAVGEPMLVFPKVFHMLWRHELVTDLSQRTLSLRTCSARAPGWGHVAEGAE